MKTTVNIFSAAFWTSAAGLAGIICGALGLGQLAQPVENLLVAIGGLLVAIPAHHVIKKQQAAPPA